MRYGWQLGSTAPEYNEREEILKILRPVGLTEAASNRRAVDQIYAIASHASPLLAVIEHERNLPRSLERFGNLLQAFPQKVEHISAHEIHTLAASLGVKDRSIEVVYKVALDQLLE